MVVCWRWVPKGGICTFFFYHFGVGKAPKKAKLCLQYKIYSELRWRYRRFKNVGVNFFDGGKRHFDIEKIFSANWIFSFFLFIIFVVGKKNSTSFFFFIKKVILQSVKLIHTHTHTHNLLDAQKVMLIIVRKELQ